MPDIIDAALQEGGKPENHGEGFLLIVTMTNGETFRGSVSVTPYAGVYRMTLWDEGTPADDATFINAAHVSSARIEF